MNKKSTQLFIFFILLNVIKVTAQVVTIADQNGNNNIVTPAPQIKIDCNYNFVPPKKIRLTATFPEIKSPTTYLVAPIVYAPVGLFTAGTPTIISADDTWSPNIPIGFPFCFYGNTYSTLNVADNGIVRFGYNSAVPEGGFSAINNTVPSPSLIKNAIFAGFQDYLVAVGAFGCLAGDNCGTISYSTIGTAPFRQMIINYNLINHFGCSNPLSPINTTKSTFQVVLYETTNVIEIYVKDKPITCTGNSSANGGVTNSLIGLNNIDGTLGIAPASPNRNTSVWSATNEAYRFTPNGTSTTVITWFDNIGNAIGSNNPVEVIPTVNTFYTVKVRYNTCTPIEITSKIDVAFDLDYPVAPDVIGKFCDVAPPFPNQSGIDVVSLLTDPLDAVGTTKTIYNSQNEADAGPNIATPITGLNNYTMTAGTKVFYYREEVGFCFVTGKITLLLYQTPLIADQIVNVCDAGNDGSETVYLPGLVPQIAGYNASTMGIEFYQNFANADAGTNPFPSPFLPITTPPGFYDVYIRVFNLQNPLCWNVSKITINLLPNLVLAPIPTFCIADPNFDGIVIADLTTIAITNTNIPVASPTYTYYSSYYEALYNLNPISNSSNHPLTIQPAPQFVTIWIVAAAVGYCPTITSVDITICVPTGGGGGPGGGGGNGGFGGAGFSACLPFGTQIPSFNLEALFNVVILPASPIPTPTGYYTTLLGAQTADPLVQLSAFEVANFVPTAVPLLSFIWVRYIDSNNVVGIKQLVIPVKFIKTQQVITKQLCDVYGDLKETINLNPTSSYIQEIQALNPGETITCYPTQNDYDNNTNPILAPYNFTLDYNTAPFRDTIYIRVSSYGCDSDYKLVFTLNPFAIAAIITKNVCDIAPFGTEPYPNLGTIITSLIPNYSSTSVFSLHSTLNGAYDNSSIIFNPINYPVSPTTSIYIRITENPILFPFACPTIQQINFGFNDSVLINAVPIIDVCDVDNDGQVVISNLNSIIDSIIDIANTDPIIKKLYYNLAAAQTNNPVDEIFPNWDNFIYDAAVLTTNGYIYLYLENTVTGCSRIVPINLTMQSVVLPVLNNPLKICDYQNDNSEIIANFNIFNSQVVPSSFLYNFQYFLSQADAIAGTPIIPANYVLINNSTIWIKITTSANTTCAKIKDYVIAFSQAPVVTDIQPKICDDLSDDLETRNLNLFIANIIPNTANYTFQYYASVQNAIDSYNQQSASYNMTFAANNLAVPIFVKVIDNVTQCFSVAKITFERELKIEAFDERIFTCDISLSNTLEGVFDLTTVIPRTGIVGMIVNPANYTITYYRDLGAILAITSPTAFTVLADQTSYVYVKFVNILTGCFTIKRIELQIYQLPKFLDGEVFICDANIDGVYLSDLNVLSSVVVNDPSPFSFAYFNTYNDAYTNINAIANITNYSLLLANFPKSIFVKGTNSNNCFKIKEVVLKTKPLISLIANDVSLLRCDANNDGAEIFNLEDANPLITNQIGLTYQYFLSFTDLQTVSNIIPNPTTYTNLTNGQFVFVRLSNPANNCDSWAKIKLNAFYENYVFPVNEVLCDNNNNGTELINLQQIVLGYVAPLNVTQLDLKFYTNIADANAGTSVGLISNPTSYTFLNFSTTIWVRLTNIVTGCPIVKKINFINPSPIVLVDIVKEICDIDRNNQETINLSSYFQSMSIPLINGFTISSYLDQNNADAGTNSISNSNYLQIIPVQTYYIRFVDSNGCFSVKSVVVKIIPLPNPNVNPAVIEICDNTTPLVLSEIFDLTIRNITNSSTDIVTYHTTQAFAQAGTNAIAANLINFYPVTGINNSVWIRVVSNVPNSLVACAVVVEQKLKIVPIPTPNLSPAVIEICDNTTPAVLSEIFDLTIRNITNSSTDIVTYHTTQAFAQAGTNAIPANQIDNYLVTGIYNSVWIRVVSNVPNSLVACAVVVEQKLKIVPIPTPNLTPAVIEICDNTTPLVLSEIFDLTIRNITNSSTDIVTYHTTQAFAQAGTNAIAANLINFYPVTGINNSVWIRVVSNVPNSLVACAVVVEQKLKIVPIPTPNLSPAVIEICDNTTPAVLSEIFDLTIRNITNSSTDIVTYHTTQAFAQAGTNAIPANQIDNYLVTGIYNSVWIRVVSNVPNSLVACAVVVEQKLKIVPIPTPNLTPAVIEICDNTTPVVLSEIFDLTIRNITNSSTDIVTYHTTQAFAQAGTNAIAANLINFYPVTGINNSVWIRVVSNVPNSLVACAIVVEQKLKIVPIPTPNLNPAVIEICDNTTPLVLSEIFDLTIRNITNSSTDIVTYHTTQAFAQAGINAIPANQINNYLVTGINNSVWIRVVSNVPNSLVACAVVVEQKLKIVPIPTPNLTPAVIEICDNTTPLVLSEIFDLTIRNITNSSTDIVTYHTTQAFAQAGTNAIAANLINFYPVTGINNSVWIRVVSNVPNSLVACAVVVEQKLKIVPIPTPNLSPAVIEICDNTTPAVLSEIFDLTIRNITNSSTDIVTYHTTQAIAQAGTNAIAANLINFYPVAGINNSVWIRVVSNVPNSLVACAVIVEQKLLIVPIPTPRINPKKLEICDNTTAALLSENFNLRTNETFIRNGNLTDIITYHLTQNQAIAGTNAIPTTQLNDYTITGINNSIWIRVVSNTPTSLTNCAIIIEQKLLIVPIPTPNLTPLVIEICDNTTPALLSEFFDLTLRNITNGSTDIVTYHATEILAINGLNVIPANLVTEYPVNGINNSVWIRVVSNVPNSLITCAVIVEQKLKIIPIPAPSLDPPVIQLCDDNLSGDLKENFNLAANESFINNGNTNYIYSYFPTKTDAENNVTSNQILNIDQYLSPSASIWIRVISNTATTLQTCAIIIEQKLLVNPLPIVAAIPNLYSCINLGNTTATFNLNDRNTIALAGQSPNNFSVTWHLLQADAKNDINELLNIYLSNTKIIYASILNNLTGCRNTSPLQIIAETTTTATQPTGNQTYICDNDLFNDGLTKFKLLDLNATILGTQTSANYTLNYYANQNDLNQNIPINQLVDYTTITNPQTIIAVVTNTASNVVPKKCSAQINIILNVKKLPEPNPKDGFVCYEQRTGNLLSTYTINSELNNSTHTFQWFFNNSTTPIVGANLATLLVPTAGDYTVIATQKSYPFCKSLPKKITVTKSEPALATARVEYSFTENLNVVTIATGLGSYVYQMDNNAVQTSNLFENVAPGTHKITVIDEFGCANFVLSVIVLDYIRFFTPNSDGINDKWNILGIKDQPNAKVYIFDRYGKFMTQVKPGSGGWDGTYNNQIMPSDDYWFTVTYDENGEQKEFKSHFAMKR